MNKYFNINYCNELRCRVLLIICLYLYLFWISFFLGLKPSDLFIFRLKFHCFCILLYLHYNEKIVFLYYSVHSINHSILIKRNRSGITIIHIILVFFLLVSDFDIHFYTCNLKQRMVIAVLIFIHKYTLNTI